jgi:hypothetical protein
MRPLNFSRLLRLEYLAQFTRDPLRVRQQAANNSFSRKRHSERPAPRLRSNQQAHASFFDVALGERHQPMDEVLGRCSRVAGALVGHRVDYGGRGLIAREHADAPPFGKRRRPHAQVPTIEEKVSGLDHDIALTKNA